MTGCAASFTAKNNCVVLLIPTKVCINNGSNLKKSFYWPSLNKDVKRHVNTCSQCQKCKKQNVKYGKLPEKDIENMKPLSNIMAKNDSFALNAITMIIQLLAGLKSFKFPNAPQNR